jgi:hypothetical protein
LVNADKDDFGPRVGLAWSIFKNTVIRSGYGRFFSYQEIRTGDPLQLAYNLPFFYQPTFISDGITPVLTVSGGFPSQSESGDRCGRDGFGLGRRLPLARTGARRVELQHTAPAPRQHFV